MDLTPEEHKRLILNIRKQKERAKGKGAKDNGEDEDDALQQEIQEHKQAHEMRRNASKQPQNKPKFDDLMKDSGSEGEEGEDDDFLPAQLKEQLANKLSARKNKQGTWLREDGANDMDDDEPLDFLDRNAISRVVCKSPPLIFYLFVLTFKLASCYE